MILFHPEKRHKSHRSRRFYTATKIAYSAVDFTAAMCFLVGSVLFFRNSLEMAAIWLSGIGSFFFAMKPTIRLWREVELAAMGDTEDLATRR